MGFFVTEPLRDVVEEEGEGYGIEGAADETTGRERTFVDPLE